MLVYPIAYTCLTLPLAVVRMAAQAGRPLGMTPLLVAGACMASCGWVDILLYMVTRRTIITLHAHSSGSNGTGEIGMGGLAYGNTTTIGGNRIGNFSENESQEGFVKLERVVEITVETAPVEESEAEEPRRPVGNLHDGNGFW